MNLVHSFGSSCSQKYRYAITICDEDINEPKVVFPAGKNMAMKYIDRQQMNFVHFSNNLGSISEIVILPTRKHIATAQKPIGSQKDIITIYNMSNPEQKSQLKIFHDSDKQGTIKLMAFSASQPNFLCCLVGQPHYKLIFIDSNRNKPLAQSNFSIRQLEKISICPQNSHLICGTGSTTLVIYRVQEYAFKPLDEIKKLPKGRKFTQHAWYRKKILLVATDRCQLLILQQIKLHQFEVKNQYQNIFNDLEVQNPITWVSAMCCFSKGFIVGSNNGSFCLWTKKESTGREGDLILQPVRKWSTTEERKAQITAIETSFKEDCMVVSMDNNDIAVLGLADMMPQLIENKTQGIFKQINFDYIYKGFHNQEITGMDICIQRPLIATCSKKDSTIRIWNYKNYACQLLRMFYYKIMPDSLQKNIDKPLNTLSLHPCGYYIAVGCTDKLRLFHILNNQLRPYRELPFKNTYRVQFSQGGHLIAVALNSGLDSGQQYIKVIDALTLVQIVIFKDHYSPITTLEWKLQDECLCSTSQKGGLIQWKVMDWTENKNLMNKKTINFCMTYCQDRKSIVTYSDFGNHYLLQEFFQNGQNFQLEVDMKVQIMKQIKTPFIQGLVLGLQNGSIIIFGGLHKPLIIQHCNDNLKAVNSIIISPCNNYLITAGSDSLIFIYKLYQKIEGVRQSQATFPNNTVDDFLADVVLINKKQVTTYYEKQQQLSKAKNILHNKLEQTAIQTGKKNQQRISQIQNQKKRITNDLNYRIQRLEEQVELLNKDNHMVINQLDNKNLIQAEQLQRSYQQKLQFQEQRYFQLQQQIIQAKLLHKQEVKQLKQQEKVQIERIKVQIGDKFKESEQVFTKVKQTGNKASVLFEERLKQIQEEQEEELRQLQLKIQKTKQQNTVVLMQLKQRQVQIKKKHASLCHERQQLKKQFQDGIYSKSKIDKEVEEAKEKYKDMNKQYEDKIDSLSAKEKKFLLFESKVIDLQKKKHILSYKATQMLKAIEPKEEQIEKLKIDLIKLKKQFEDSLQKKQKAVLRMQKTEKERKNLEKNLEDEIEQTCKQSALLDQIIGQIYMNIGRQQNDKDSRRYERLIVKLYHKYVEKNQKLIPQNNSKGIDQITKQINHLEKSLHQINRTGEKNVLRKNDEIDKKTKQNAELINNLNEIKKQNKQLGLKLKSKKEQISKLRLLKTQMLVESQKVDFLAYDKISEQEVIMRPQSKQKMQQNTTIMRQIEPKYNLQKKQCQIMSESQFVKQKLHKYIFMIKEMNEKHIKHLKHFRCQGQPFIILQNSGQQN